MTIMLFVSCILHVSIQSFVHSRLLISYCFSTIEKVIFYNTTFLRPAILSICEVSDFRNGSFSVCIDITANLLEFIMVSMALHSLGMRL